MLDSLDYISHFFWAHQAFFSSHYGINARGEVPELIRGFGRWLQSQAKTDRFNTKDLENFSVALCEQLRYDYLEQTDFFSVVQRFYYKDPDEFKTENFKKFFWLHDHVRDWLYLNLYRLEEIITRWEQAHHVRLPEQSYTILKEHIPSIKIFKRLNEYLLLKQFQSGYDFLFKMFQDAHISKNEFKELLTVYLEQINDATSALTLIAITKKRELFPEEVILNLVNDKFQSYSQKSNHCGLRQLSDIAYSLQLITLELRERYNTVIDMLNLNSAPALYQYFLKAAKSSNVNGCHCSYLMLQENAGNGQSYFNQLTAEEKLTIHKFCNCYPELQSFAAKIEIKLRAINAFPDEPVSQETLVAQVGHFSPPPMASSSTQAASASSSNNTSIVSKGITT